MISSPSRTIRCRATTAARSQSLIWPATRKFFPASGSRFKVFAWSPDGKEIWFTASKSGTDRTLYATSLDGKQRIVARLPGALMLLDIAKDGRVLLVRATWRRELLGVFDNDPKQHELSWLDYTYPSDLSADGKTLLFDEEGGGGALDYSKSGGLTYAVYIRKTDGSPAVLLGEGGAVALSPDGKWVIAQTQESPSQFRLLPTAAGEPRDLTKDNVNHSWAHWFPDGKRILFSADEPGKGVRFYVYDLASGKSQPFRRKASTAPPSRSLPTRSRSPPSAPIKRDICIPLPVANLSSIAGINQGEQPITWSADGHSLYIYQPGELPARVYRLDVKSGTAHSLERAHALRSRRSRKHRPHLHDPRRQKLRLRLSPNVGGLVFSRRPEVTWAGYAGTAASAVRRAQPGSLEC